MEHDDPQKEAKTAQYPNTQAKQEDNRIAENFVNMQQRAATLDAWLYAVDKAGRLGRLIDLDLQYALFKELAPKRPEDTIDTDETDYGTYEKHINL